MRRRSGRGEPIRWWQVLLALGLTCLVTLAVLWGVVSRGQAQGPTGKRVEVDFARAPDGPAPARFDGGEPATVRSSSADAQLTVVAGRLTFRPTTDGVAAASFSTPDLGAPITGIGARWVFRPGVGSDGAIVLAVSRSIDDDVPQPIPPIPVHLVVTPLSWNLSVLRDNGSDLDEIATANFRTPLAEDGRTVYEARLSLHGGSVTVELPETHEIVKDPRISEWHGNFATFELYSNRADTDSTGEFESFWADSREAST